MIRVEVLGGFRVFRDGEELAALPTKPQRAALLAYLAIEHEASRDRVCFLLWPDIDADRGRHALSQTLYELKRELGASWAHVSGERVATTSDLEVDLHSFDKAVEGGRHEDVIELYGGPLLDDVQLRGGVEFERWVEGKRSEIHRKVRVAFHAATESATHLESRLRLARAWVELDPLDDEAQHTLIESLGAAGSRTAALEQYREYKELIEVELDVEPLDQTKELVERIKSGVMSDSTPISEAWGGSGDPPSEEDPTAASIAREHGSGPQLASDLRVVRRIGVGATGSVYLAREPALRRLVAVKVLDPELAKDATASARFEREAQSAAKILHPHVATVFRVGVTADHRPFFVMPYIKGVTLAGRIKARGPLGGHEAARILSEAASALAAAHAVDVIHRDVRPANVLYEEETGRTYLADFGVAGILDSGSEEIKRLTKKGELLGNPEYISPEQRNGEPLDGRSDVYSLGVMGCELLLGRPSPDAAALDEVDPNDSDLVDLLRRATASEAHHRPSAAELADALGRLAARYDPQLGVLGRLRKRRMLPFVAAYVAGGVAGMGGVDQLVQQDLLAPIAYRLALAFFVAGLNATIIVAWFHGERGRQRVSATEVVLLSAVLFAWVIASVIILI